MLTSDMVKKLNDQLNLEFFSSNQYLQMSAWCDDKGFEGAAKFLRNQAQEEMEHMQRIFTYISECNAFPSIGAIQAPVQEFDSLGDVFHKSYQHELNVTSKINELTHFAFNNQDLSTFNFLQWFIAEQHEEEKLFKSVLDKIELVGADGAALFFIDRELSEIAIKPTGSILSST